jgi:hypothetical protein
MGQITIYLDDETGALLRAAVKASGLSQSQWVADAVRSRVHNEWPETVRALSGAWRDFPSIAEIRRGRGIDAARERL